MKVLIRCEPEVSNPSYSTIYATTLLWYLELQPMLIYVLAMPIVYAEVDSYT